MSVYFAKVGQYIKVGWSTRPEHRVKSISFDKTLKPLDFDPTQPVELLKTAPGGSPSEGWAHSALHDFRVRGEWFQDCPEVREYIALHGGDRQAFARYLLRRHGLGHWAWWVAREANPTGRIAVAS